jgi:hypothetical protein
MKFDINIWNKYRKQAKIIGDYIQSFKDKKGHITMEPNQLELCIRQITDILNECSTYMDKCGITASITPWMYDPENPETQPSSIAFLHKDKMPKSVIAAYGRGFMSKPVKESKFY